MTTATFRGAAPSCRASWGTGAVCVLCPPRETGAGSVGRSAVAVPPTCPARALGVVRAAPAGSVFSAMAAA
ncbi:hypothetical protein San01_52450 [Streptomyces angustmyceticus]|uniref:Uncharacterized protein n=1 Tax=Streptomyces angustmyceticus TaxID=285578 RepID=A0A5J4LF12_9ACTN|nr:hypothetical protein San01_52450 [Streptomyces angustmyceticus]